MGRVLHPEIELLGPSNFDLRTDVEAVLYQEQASIGGIEGYDLYDLILSADNLKNHLGLADLLGIQAKGISIFDELYSHKEVIGWRSISTPADSEDVFMVPYLSESSDRQQVELYWAPLECSFTTLDRALRFRQ